MFQDMVGNAVNVSGYCGSAVSLDSTAIITGYGRECCQCFTWLEVLSVLQIF